jgi:hypothetical protein
MKKKNLDGLKLKKEIISKATSETIEGGSQGCADVQSFHHECYWSLGTVDVTNKLG